MEYEGLRLKTEGDVSINDNDIDEAEKKFKYFFTKLQHNANRRNSNLRRSSIDKEKSEISSILGITENFIIKESNNTKGVKVKSGTSNKKDRLEDFKISANLQVKEFKNKFDKLEKKLVKAPNGTTITPTKVGHKNEVKINGIHKPNSGKPVNLNSSMREPESNLKINETPKADSNLNRRASITPEEVQSGNCKYDFLISEFAKIFGENLENYDERGISHIYEKFSFIYDCRFFIK